MHLHGRKRSKTIKNHEKVPFSSSIREAHEEKGRKEFVGQQLGVFQRTFTSFTLVAHVEKSTKTTKFLMSNHLGVTLNR